MRLLLLLSFLGFRLVINIIPAQETSSPAGSSITSQVNVNSAPGSTENARTESTTPTPTAAIMTVQVSSSADTSVTSIQPSTSAKPSSATTQVTHPTASQTESGTATTVEKTTSSSTSASTASITSSQSISILTATSATETSTSQNSSTSPNAATKTSQGDSKPPETNTASSVQTSVSTQSQVVTESADMTGNTTSSTSNDTQSSTTNGTERNGKTTQEPDRNAYSEEVKCKKEPSEGALNMIIEQKFNCENFVEKNRNDLAKKLCPTLPMNNSNIDKCEVWLSFAENRLFVEVYLRVKVKEMEIETMLKNRIKDIKEDKNESMELKKLVAMVVTGSLLLLILLSGVVYRCSQHKSKHKDPYLTEELRTVDNGCHDNPAMDITERDSEMEEKNYCKATFLENADGWIVPMDTHIKDELDEEDTHL